MDNTNSAVGTTDDADSYAEDQVKSFALEAAEVAEKAGRFDIRDAFRKIAENFWI